MGLPRPQEGEGLTMTDKDTLTRNQRRALAALLANRTVTAAAEVIGLRDRQIYRYLELPAFRAALAQAEAEQLNEAGRRLLAGQGRALDTLEEIIEDGAKDSDRRQAAATWLDFMFRYRDLAVLEQRLSELEQAVYHGDPKA